MNFSIIQVLRHPNSDKLILLKPTEGKTICVAKQYNPGLKPGGLYAVNIIQKPWKETTFTKVTVISVLGKSPAKTKAKTKA
jgi:hypothetical protein